MLSAFRMADDVLFHGVQGITDLITTPGLINTDFADVRMIMQNAGSALMGIGHASGDGRAVNAARAAISSPLLEASLEGARGLLLNVSGPSDLGLFEVNEAAEIVRETAHPDANIIFGAVIDDAMGDEVRITVIAAGFDRFEGERGAVPEGRTAPDAPTTPRAGRRPESTRPTSLGLDQGGGFGDDDDEGATTSSTSPSSCADIRGPTARRGAPRVISRRLGSARVVWTDRHGGVSVAPYDSLNLGDHVGDAVAAVEENRALLARRLDLASPTQWQFLRQVHGNSVVTVDHPPSGGGPPPEADAAVTAIPDVPLVVLDRRLRAGRHRQRRRGRRGARRLAGPARRSRGGRGRRAAGRRVTGRCTRRSGLASVRRTTSSGART